MGNLPLLHLQHLVWTSQPLPFPPRSLSHTSPSAKSVRNSRQMTLTNFFVLSFQSILTWCLIPRSPTNGRRSQKLFKQRVHVLGAITRHSRTRSRVCSLGYRCILFLFLFLFIFIYLRLANN